MYSSAKSVADRLGDVPHRLGLAVHAIQDGSHAFAVVHVPSGQILAWDGWYAGDLPEGSVAAESLPWDEWDDMPSKLLVRANGPWLREELANWLMPTYSVARESARLLASHYRSTNFEDTPLQFTASDVVAYLPIVDEDVLLEGLHREAQQRPSVTQLIDVIEKLLD